MRKTAIITAIALASASPALAQGLIRGHIDNALNSAERMLGNDSAEMDVRSLTDKIALRDEEISKMLAIITQKAREREAYASALANMGVQSPPPLVIAPPEPPAGTIAGENQTCLTTLSGAPIFCW